jgi:hypothetical protein
MTALENGTFPDRARLTSGGRHWPSSRGRILPSTAELGASQDEVAQPSSSRYALSVTLA